MFSEILDIALLTENIQEVIQSMIQLLNVTNVSWKNLTFKMKRKKIIDFMNLFFDDLTLPQTPEEKEIQLKYDRESR